MNNIIGLHNINKKYHTLNEEINAISNISFSVEKGKIISLVGPSGCGKSTILSLLSGLDNEYTGCIVKENSTSIAYMLQSDALLPFLTVYENCLLGLKIQNKINNDNIKYIDYLLDLYNLKEFKNIYPKNLSGGMKQRVALIRTLSLKPDILLLDEPFSALDQQSRLLISEDVHQIVKEKNITVILVTHNLEEAIYFSDQVIILSKRPAVIKRIINIDIDSDKSIFDRRKDNNFNKYFDIIWGYLDTNE